MIQKLVPQQNQCDAARLKPFLIDAYEQSHVRQFITYTLRPFSEKQIDAWLSSPEDEHVQYVAFMDKDQITGLAIVGENEEYGCELIGLIVLPDFQQHGIGRQLVQHIIKTAREAGWRSIDVRVFADNKKMLKLVIDEDFIPVQIEYHKRADGVDMVFLKKYL